MRQDLDSSRMSTGQSPVGMQRETGSFRGLTARAHHCSFQENLLHFSASADVWKKHENYVLQDCRDVLLRLLICGLYAQCKLKFLELIFLSFRCF